MTSVRRNAAVVWYGALFLVAATGVIWQLVLFLHGALYMWLDHRLPGAPPELNRVGAPRR
jgi:hypothetical protein